MVRQPLFIGLTDDDPDDREIFEDALAQIRPQSELITFQHGRELLDYLKDPPEVLPDIMFLDLNMPAISGKQCLKEIRSREEFDKMIIAIYSTSTAQDHISETFEMGANLYINKPNSFHHLIKILERILVTDWQQHAEQVNRQNFVFKV